MIDLPVVTPAPQVTVLGVDPFIVVSILGFALMIMVWIYFIALLYKRLKK